MRKFSAVIVREEASYVAHCTELGVVSQGKTIEKAEANLQEAIELYQESFGALDGTNQDAVRPECRTCLTPDIENSELDVAESEIVEFVKEDRETPTPRS